MANSYDINYDDERLTAVENERQDALNENEQLYSGMISDADKYYQDQIQASKDWADTQTQLQQENTDFAIAQIEQQKEQAQKDYTKEQSGAYVDWQKQSNRYGANAEQMAAAGMSGTGYSESSQVSMYNTYQNRVSTARESYNQAVLNYNNSIKEAQLQNNSILAEIAYQALQQQLELSLEGFQYKNQLVLDQANRKTELDNIYHQRYQDVLDQINTDRGFAYQQERDKVADEQFKEQMALSKEQWAWEKAQAERASSSGSSGVGESGYELDHIKAMSTEEIVSAMTYYNEVKDNRGLEAFLDDLVKTKRIDEEQADKWYEQYRIKGLYIPTGTDVEIVNPPSNKAHPGIVGEIGFYNAKY